MKPLFNNVAAKYKKQDGFVILIRDNLLYLQGENLFYRANGLHSSSFSFESIKETDRIYKFDKEEDMVDNVGRGACIEKFRFKLEQSIIDASTLEERIKELTKNGTCVGFIDTNGNKYTVGYKEAFIYYNKTMGFSYRTLFNTAGRYYYFDNEPLAYKWLFS